MTFDVGDSVPIAVNVKDSTGALVNATGVTLTITLPDGTTATPTVTNPPAVTGQYTYTYVPTVIGRHEWRFVTTTPNTAYQDVFEVRDTASPSLISLADAKAHLNIPATTTSQDDELREFIEAVTAVVEQYVGPIVKRTYTRRLSGNTYRMALPHTQILNIISVTLVWDGSSPFNVADLSVDPTTGIVTFKNAMLFPYWDMDWTYQVGRTYVDPNWSLAAKIILQHNWGTQVGNLPSVQGDDVGFTQTGSGYLVPYRALALLDAGNIAPGFA